MVTLIHILQSLLNCFKSGQPNIVPPEAGLAESLVADGKDFMNPGMNPFMPGFLSRLGRFARDCSSLVSEGARPDSCCVQSRL